MRTLRVLLFGLSGAAGAGCFSARPSAPDSFVCQATRNIVQQPIRHHDDKTFIKFVRHRATEAFEQQCEARGCRFSNPYRDGFIEGFIDYVEAGGNGEPPYLPPFRYRLTKYRSADGVAIIEQWYAGFRHGATVARGSGLRELNYVPLPGPAIPNDVQLTAPPEPAVPFAPSGERSPWDRPELLPRPKAIPPATDPMPPVPAPAPRPIPPSIPNLPAPPAAAPAPVKPAAALVPAAPVVPHPEAEDDPWRRAVQRTWTTTPDTQRAEAP